MNELFQKNIGLKIVAVMLALALERYFYSPDNSVMAHVSVRVQVANVPPSKIVVAPMQGERGIFAEMQIRGPRSLIQQVQAASKVFTISLPRGVSETYSAKLDVGQLGLSSAVEVIDVNPSTLEIRLERRVKKQVVVKAETNGVPAKGYTLAGVIVAPGKVLVNGPESELLGLQTISTKPIDIAGLRKIQRREVSLSPVGRLTTLGVNVVNVEVKVVPIQEEKRLSDVSIKVLAPKGFAATVEPSKVKLVLTGPENKVRAIMGSDVLLQVDAQRLGAGTYSLAATAPALPSGVSLVTTMPKQVQVNLVTTEGDE